MTPEEFIKKYCNANHNTEECIMKKDLEDVLEYDRQFNHCFFSGNGPGGVLQSYKELTDEEYSAIKKEWENRHKELVRANKVKILDQICGENGYWCMSALCKRCEEMGQQ